MKKKEKKLNIVDYGQIIGIIFGGIGLILGVVYSIGGFFVDLFTTGLNYGTFLAMGALVAMPLILGVVGFFVGIIGAIFYNFLR